VWAPGWVKWNPRWWSRNDWDQLNLLYLLQDSTPNSPELLTYHHSHYLTTTLNFTLFIVALLGSTSLDISLFIIVLQNCSITCFGSLGHRQQCTWKCKWRWLNAAICMLCLFLNLEYYWCNWKPWAICKVTSYVADFSTKIPRLSIKTKFSSSRI